MSIRHDQNIIDLDDTRRFVSSAAVMSADPERYKWATTTADFNNATTVRVGGYMYLNVPVELHSGDTEDMYSGSVITARIIRTLVDGEYLLEEIVGGTMSLAEISKTRLLTAPGYVWENAQLPMELQPADMVEIGQGLTAAYTYQNMMTNVKNRWTIGTFSDPGHRRDLDYNPGLIDIAFTETLSLKNVQIMNTALGMYTIYVQDAPVMRGNGMRMVDEDITDTNMMSFWAYTAPNDGATAPDDSVWQVLVMPGSDGINTVTNTFNTDFIWGSGITASGVNGHMEYWNSNGHQAHPEWAAMTGGQDYGGAAEVNPSPGVIFEKVDGENQYLINFPAQDGMAQYLVLIQPTTSSGLAFLCRKDKMGDFIFDTNDLLTGTNEERNYKLATMTLTVLVDPVGGGVPISSVPM